MLGPHPFHVLGLLEEKGAGTVRELLNGKRAVVTGSKGQRVDQVVEAMRQHGISQMPVMSEDGRAVGMIHEYDLLNALVANKVKFADTIDSIVAPLQGVVSPETSLTRLREVFNQDKVAVVKDGEKILAIVTKIDLIEYMHRTGA